MPARLGEVGPEEGVEKDEKRRGLVEVAEELGPARRLAKKGLDALRSGGPTCGT